MDFNFANYLRKYGQDIPSDLVFKAAMKEKKIKPKSKDSGGNGKDCHRCKMVNNYIIMNHLMSFTY
jgi:hypothetical protein